MIASHASRKGFSFLWGLRVRRLCKCKAEDKLKTLTDRRTDGEKEEGK